MGQKENKEQFLRLHSIITGSRQTLEQITSKWDIAPNISLIHDTELSGKVTSGTTVSVKDYYPLVEESFDTDSGTKARI